LLSGSAVADLDRQRQALGVSLLDWRLQAGVPHSSFFRYLKGAPVPRPVQQRLAAALERLGRAAPEEDAAHALLVAVSFGGFQAQAMGIAALFAAPDRCALMARDIALYGVNQMAGVRQAVLARHVGLTRARVCQAIRAIEDLRDADTAFDRALARLIFEITGQEE
jgi:hypothetical protein